MKLTEALLSVVTLLALTAKAAPMFNEGDCVPVDDSDIDCNVDLGGGGGGPTGVTCNNGLCASLVRGVMINMFMGTY